MKKVLIIAGSPRKNGNSDLLAQQFAKGAEERGNEVEIVYLRDLKINYCHGCLVCLKKGECFQKDDANSLLPKMMAADVVCFSCPVYYYSVSGQMKTFIDRMNPLYDKMKNKDFYYMLTAQDDSHKQLDRAFDVFDGFADCFEDIRRCGRIYGGGADQKGEVKELPVYNEAYELGKSIK
mgnify:CR=1 FL=1